MTSGIYRWRQISTGFVYIGSSVEIERRRKEYWYLDLPIFDKSSGGNIRLYRAWRKYGPDDFVFEVIELIETRDLQVVRDREQWYLDNVVRWGVDFNIAREVGRVPSIKGRSLSDETKSRLSERNKKLGIQPPSAKGRKYRSEQYIGRQDYRKGVKLSDEVKQRMSEGRQRYLKEREAKISRGEITRESTLEWTKKRTETRRRNREAKENERRENTCENSLDR